jgi:two-component system chemotaxis response regulator CheB
VGHAWNAENLLAQQSHGIETALWTALRALEESAQLSRQLAVRMTGRGSTMSAAAFARRAEETEENAQLLRRVLVDGRITISDSTSEFEDVEVEGSPERGDPSVPSV